MLICRFGEFGTRAACDDGGGVMLSEALRNGEPIVEYRDCGDGDWRPLRIGEGAKSGEFRDMAVVTVTLGRSS